MDTYGSALERVGVSVPGHLAADAEVPVLTGVQAQGDLLVVPAGAAPAGAGEPVTAAGIQVVHGEATGNTHWLHAGFDSPGVRWWRNPGAAGDGPDRLVVGRVEVPAGETALLIHTDEHGANGIGPGTYEIRRKQELGLGLDRARPRFVLD